MTELSQETVIERAHHALEFDEDTGQRVIAVLIILVTVLAAGTALLERVASTHQAHSDRLARTWSVVAVGNEVEADTRLSEELALRHAWRNVTKLAADYSALTTGPGAAHAQALGAAYSVASRALEGLTGEFFGIKKSDGTLDYDRFYAETVEPGSAAEEWAAAYARERGDWAAKRGFYIAVITVFAVALFLLGLTLTVPKGHRLLFLGAGSIFGLAGIALGLVTVTRPVTHPSGQAIGAYAHAAAVDAAEDDPQVAADRDKFREVTIAARNAIERRPDYQKAWRLLADNELYLDLTADGGPRGSPSALDAYARAVELDEHDYFAWVNYAVALFWNGEFAKAVDANSEALAIQPNRPIVNMNQAVDMLLRDYERNSFRSIVRTDDYRLQLESVRRVLAVAPDYSRNVAIDGSIRDTNVMVKARPQYGPAMRASLEDLLRIDHELDAARAKKTPGAYGPSRGRVAISRIAFAADGKAVDLDLCYTGMAPADERLYYVYVDNERVATRGPWAWRDSSTGLGLPGTNTSMSLPPVELGSDVVPSARVRVEVFINGRLRAKRTVGMGQPYLAGTSC